MLAQSNMNRLAEVLDELNMIEFHPVLNGAAYETWEDVLNITETDLYVIPENCFSGLRLEIDFLPVYP